jgi:hypothetical protein
MIFMVKVPQLDVPLYGGNSRMARVKILGLVEKITKSGRLLQGGLFADDHGGYLLLESPSWSKHEELLTFLFGPKASSVESHPILPFDKLTSLFERLDTEEKQPPNQPVKAKRAPAKIAQPSLP